MRTAVLIASLGLALATPALAGEKILGPTPISHASSQQAACVTARDIATSMITGQAQEGGRILALVDGADQSFADAWRKLSQMPAMKVGLVLAHVYAGPRSALFIDTVEFDENGCAVSRTLLNEATWTAIIGAVGDEPANSNETI